MVRPWSAFETSNRGTSFVQSRHGARNRSNLITIPPPPWRANWAAYVMVPDSPAYTIGLELPSGFRTGEQMWDIDLGYWRRAVATIPPDEFVRPGVSHIGRSHYQQVGNFVADSQEHEDELFVYPWAIEDSVPDRIWPQSRPFPPDIVLAGQPGEPTYRFGNHQAPFDAYFNFVGQPQDLVALSVSSYGRNFWPDPDQYEQRGPGAGDIPAQIRSGTRIYYWNQWFNEGLFNEVRDATMMPHSHIDGNTDGHIRNRIGDAILFDNAALFGGEPEFEFDRGSIFYRESDIEEGILPSMPPYDVGNNNIFSRLPRFRHRWLKDLAWQLAPGSFA